MMRRDFSVLIITILQVTALLLGVMPPASVLAQDETPATTSGPALYIPFARNGRGDMEPTECAAGWELRYTATAIDVLRFAQQVQVPVRYVTWQNPTAGTVIPARTNYCHPANPAVSWYDNQLEAIWLANRNTYADAALLAVAVDGPLPVGDLVAVGLLLAAGGGSIVATIYQVNSGPVIAPTFAGWEKAGDAPILLKMESWGDTQVSYFESPDVVWGRESVWVLPLNSGDPGELAAIIDLPAADDLSVYIAPQEGWAQADDFGSILLESRDRPNIKGTTPVGEYQRRQIAQKRWPVLNPDGSIFTGGFAPDLIKPVVPGAHQPPDHVAQHGDEEASGDGKDVSFSQTMSYRLNEWTQDQFRKGLGGGPSPKCWESLARNGARIIAVFVRVVVRVWDGAQWVQVANGSWNVYYSTPKPRSASFWTKSSIGNPSELQGASSGWEQIPCDQGPFDPGGTGLIPATNAAIEGAAPQ